MPDVLVTENIVGAALTALQQRFDVAWHPQLWQSPAELIERVDGARALVVRNQTQVTAEVITGAARLQIIARAGVGLDNIDVDAASRAGIVVSYAADANSVSVAELTLALMLALARRIPAAHFDTCGGGWHRQRFTGGELLGKTLGIVGLGRIGALTAERARAFGMHVVAHDEFIDPQSPRVRELAARLVSLDELLQTADVVSCHVPLTGRTQGMFGYERFALMKPTACFLNTSRGEVVDEDGLVRAIQEQRIAGAALDVRQHEPPSPSPLCELENVILTPHIGAFTHEAQQRVVETICRDVQAVLDGDPAVGFANFPRPRR